MISSSNIHEFFVIRYLKNGSLRVSSLISLAVKIDILSEKHFFHNYIGKKKVYYERTETGFDVIVPHNINNFVNEKIIESLRCSEKLEVKEIKACIDAFIGSNRPISMRTIHSLCPYTELSDADKHLFNMSFDINYRRESNHNLLLQKFAEWGLVKALGSKDDTLSNGKPVFYKNIGQDKYLVFNYASLIPEKHVYNLDPWIAYYKSESSIGKVTPYILKELGYINFQLERDYHFIKEYVE